MENYPDPPILAFFDFLAFFRFPIFLAFFVRFPSFSKDFRGSAKFSDCPCFFFVRFPSLSKDFRGSAKRKTLAFFGGKTLCFFHKKKQGLEGQGRWQNPPLRGVRATSRRSSRSPSESSISLSLRETVRVRGGEGASILLRREGGFLRREGGFLRRGEGS